MKNVNMWVSEFDTDGVNYWPKNAIESESDPTTEGVSFYPIINERRVTRASYRPYISGSKEWRDAANDALASRGRSNFQNGKR